jgi:hypothetical protein
MDMPMKKKRTVASQAAPAQKTPHSAPPQFVLYFSAALKRNRSTRIGPHETGS